MRPGAYGLIACGTRTQHRMVCNIEDSGFEIRDVITWHYGSGFPKNMNMANGKGTALKPATEFWTLVRKSLSEKTIAENIFKWNTGYLNIDTSRISLNGEKAPTGSAKRIFNSNSYADKNSKYGTNITTPNAGRFPANVIFDDFTANILNEQSGILKSGKPGIKHKGNEGAAYHEESRKPGTQMSGFGDIGGASRFFYCAKASKSERNKGLRSNNDHPTVKPVNLMRYFVKLITPIGGGVLDPFNGSGTTGIACKLEGFNYTGIEIEKKSCDMSKARIKAW